MSDHADVIRADAIHYLDDFGSETHADDCPGCRIDAALDALVARAEAAEAERDEALRTWWDQRQDWIAVLDAELTAFALWLSPVWSEDNEDDVAAAERTIAEFKERL